MSLHPDIARELDELREAGLRSGELLATDRLAECYATFRRRFGPDVLAGLDGVALLEAMHLHGNKESLVYWLEFKNDEEFPGVFGSIAGGSALKFGIYRRAETGKWMAGSPQNQQHDPWKRPAPTPRPDYAVLRGAKVVALLDAKYMDLWDRRGIGRDVLYQLARYALSQPPDTPATILYPTTDPAARDARVDISDPVRGGRRAHVVARPVQLDHLGTLLSDAGTLTAVRERAAYAAWLAFGPSA